VHRFSCALDAKRNLLRQAQPLGLYDRLVLADANRDLPFRTGAFRTVFSNILYWLDDPEHAFREVARILAPDGVAMLCLQDPRFREYCWTYNWPQAGPAAVLLRTLNRGRDACSKWTVTLAQLRDLARRSGLALVEHRYYLSPLTLRAWDIGLRPLSPVLIRVMNSLDEPARAGAKAEWLSIVGPFMAELAELDRGSRDQGGYHFACLEKRGPTGHTRSRT
jgi:SAM-dependent methyltransferase